MKKEDSKQPEFTPPVQSKRVHDRTTAVYSDCLSPPFPFRLRPPQLEVNNSWNGIEPN
ncbi:hypothetical protein A2U01_0085797, partial [Trifolium medium]|nr:hypothetical protein [Trifolium medium]